MSVESQYGPFESVVRFVIVVILGVIYVWGAVTILGLLGPTVKWWMYLIPIIITIIFLGITYERLFK